MNMETFLIYALGHGVRSRAGRRASGLLPRAGESRDDEHLMPSDGMPLLRQGAQAAGAGEGPAGPCRELLACALV